MKALEAIREGQVQGRDPLSFRSHRRKGPPTLFEVDEGPRDSDLQKHGQAQACFKEDGVVTAGNSSKISDGASALVLMAKEKAQSFGIQPMAQSRGPGCPPGVELETYWSPQSKRSQRSSKRQASPSRILTFRNQ